MRGSKVRRVLVLLAAAVLCLGLVSAEALAGTKKKTAVVFFSSSPKLNRGGKVTAKGTLNTASACKPSRGMRLFLTDASGVVQATLDGSTSDATGNWKLQGQVPNTVPPSSPLYVRVKATKRTAGKFVCRAGFSLVIQVR
jgi:hypothetical protein